MTRCNHRYASRNAIRGFTLVELFVVIAIITLLIAILLPSMRSAIEIARETTCRSQLHQVHLGFISFTSEHLGTLPGNWGGWGGSEPWQKAWIGQEVNAYTSSPPHDGTLLKYVGGKTTVQDKQLYRCPSLDEGTLGSSIGSNGTFDYAMFISFTGVKMSLMPTSATVTDPGTGDQTQTSVPILTEEDPAYYLNSGGNREGGHGNTDQDGNWHRGGINVASMNGAVTRIEYSDRGATGWEWTAAAPSGAIVPLDGNSPYQSWHSK